MTDQLALLKSRGLLVDNDTAALNYLARIGYYRLSGYWYPLRVIDTETSLQQNQPVRFDHFMPESHFEDVVKLYVFDKKLRLLALDALERIEMALRVDVAHLLGAKEPCAHLNPNCLHGNFAKKAIKKGPNKGKTEHQVWLEKYDTMLNRSRREPFIVHHREKYNGGLPVWVAIEVWDFGLLSRLFEGMQYADKNRIAQKYGLSDGEQLAKWLKSLNFVRNVSAHHSRLWNINILELSSRSAGWPLINHSRPFMYFAIMAHLLAVICPNSSWTQRLITLIHSFPSSKNGILSLQDFGVVEGAIEWLGHFQK
ncbi:abortive phage resistance protein [Arsukibacterium ikkense]|uniref:Abortive phage resistance protein n=2 Tax=Arsukibacterium ikkense TaxID=336831 RepID=A0A0M2V1S4_9GAMM|nr:abortive phage resistance protein [Arsukibacterium ikkense]